MMHSLRYLFLLLICCSHLSFGQTGTLMPDYLLLNAGVYYNSGKYRINFNLNNITNEEYYIGYWSVNPQRSRNFNLSFACRF